MWTSKRHLVGNPLREEIKSDECNGRSVDFQERYVPGTVPRFNSKRNLYLGLVFVSTRKILVLLRYSVPADAAVETFLLPRLLLVQC